MIQIKKFRRKIMKRSKLTGLAVSAASVLFATGLTACGGADASKGDATKAQSNNVLVYAGEAEKMINPLLNTHGELETIVFSGLTKYDGSGKPIEDLAEKYQYNDANETYTFTLRKGVKWHDGKDFNADDVVYTYKQLTENKDISASVKSNYEDIKEIKKIDDFTVEFKLDHYDAAMLDYFSIGILPKHICEGQDINTMDFNQHPVGTGKYKFESWDTAGGMITLNKNENYYGNVPKISKVVYKTVSVESTKATMLQSGEADFAWLNSKYAKQFEGNDAFKQWEFTTADYRGAAMDMKTDFWKQNADSIGVLNYALDKEQIVKNVLLGQGAPAYSPIQRNPLGTNKDADIYPYDLNKFAKEMENLGWKKGADGIYERNGQKFSFTVQTRDFEEERVDIANVMSDMLKKAGVEMKVVLVNKFDWKAGYNGFLAGYATQFDPDMIYAQYVTNASSNNMSYSNPEIDKLLEEGRHEKDPVKRKAIYGEFEKEYAKKPGVLLVAYLQGNYVGTSKLKGPDTQRVLGHHAVGVLWNIEEWTIEK